MSLNLLEPLGPVQAFTFTSTFTIEITITTYEIYEPEPPGTLRACPGLYLYLYYCFQTDMQICFSIYTEQYT